MKQSTLYTIYKTSIAPTLKEKFGFKSDLQVPKVEKVVLNVGYGRHVKDKAYIDNVDKTLRAVTGQKPIHNKAKKSISNFKLREGMEIGASVTLRGPSMYDFLYKLVNLALPRVRDFRGIVTKGFDGRGNYSFGLKDQTAFPEVSADMGGSTHGVEITVMTSAKNDEEGEALLTALGFPFKKDNK
jgi:large subunit ribosomal protein L5